MNPKKLRRAIRLAVFAGLALTVGIYFRMRPARFDINDYSMFPAFQPGSEPKIRIIEADIELERDEWVLFAIGTIAYYGVVRGLPGDRITAPEGYVAVNGQPVVAHGRRFPGRPVGEVPQNKLYILCLNPGVLNDSRSFGFIAREQVRGIVLHEK